MGRPPDHRARREGARRHALQPAPRVHERCDVRRSGRPGGGGGRRPRRGGRGAHGRPRVALPGPLRRGRTAGAGARRAVGLARAGGRRRRGRRGVGSSARVFGRSDTHAGRGAGHFASLPRHAVAHGSQRSGVDRGPQRLGDGRRLRARAGLRPADHGRRAIRARAARDPAGLSARRRGNAAAGAPDRAWSRARAGPRGATRGARRGRANRPGQPPGGPRAPARRGAGHGAAPGPTPARGGGPDQARGARGRLARRWTRACGWRTRRLWPRWVVGCAQGDGGLPGRAGAPGRRARLRRGDAGAAARGARWWTSTRAETAHRRP